MYVKKTLVRDGKPDPGTLDQFLKDKLDMKLNVRALKLQQCCDTKMRLTCAQKKELNLTPDTLKMLLSSYTDSRFVAMNTSVPGRYVFHCVHVSLFESVLKVLSFSSPATMSEKDWAAVLRNNSLLYAHTMAATYVGPRSPSTDRSKPGEPDPALKAGDVLNYVTTIRPAPVQGRAIH